MHPDTVNSLGKLSLLFLTTLGVASVFFPFGTSLTGNVVTAPYWFYVVEAVLLAGYTATLLWSFLDRRFWRQHVQGIASHAPARVPVGIRLFVPYLSFVGMLCAIVGLYIHLSWSLRNPGIGTLADFMATAGGYVSEGYAAGCAISIGLRVITAVTFVVLLFADAASRNATDLIRGYLGIPMPT